MDLVALRKKAILIPTPGQTEQEYLGKHLHAIRAFYCTPQQGFDLQNALAATAHFPFETPALTAFYSTHKHILTEWIDTLPT
jgi:hypothetical protein